MPVTYCARHPKVETALSCTRCGTPICPDCMISGAVGMLCKTCAALGQSPLFQVRPERFALALVAGVLSGVIAGVLLQYVTFYIFFIAPVVGGFLGEIVLRATGHKRGRKVEWLTGGSIVTGALLSVLVTGTGHLHAPISLIYFLVAMTLVTAAAVTRIRYY